MSYILEALKKSEQERERERGELPDIKSIHTPSVSHQSEGRNWWPFILIAVVVVAAAVGTVVYIKTMQPVTPELAQVQPEPATTESNKQEAPQKTGKPAVDSKPAKQEKPKQTVAAKAEQKQPQVVFSNEQLQHDNVIGNIDQQREQSAVQQVEKELPKESGSVVQDSAIPISDIPDNVRKRIPRIAFEGHVYSSTPSRRSVMINGHKMREGDAIGEDLMLEEITPEGAEFEYKGYRFKLNALQDWSFN